MTELFRTVLIRVTLAGLVSTAAIAIVRDGALKEIVRFSAGLLLLLAFLQPLFAFSFTPLDPNRLTQDWSQAIDEAEAQNMQTTMGTLGDSIARALTKRATERGMNCTFQVIMETDTDGTLQIAYVCAYLQPGETRTDEISQMIEQECGVPPSRQELLTTEDLPN